MLISGVGMTYNAKESDMITTISKAAQDFHDKTNEVATHVSVPKSVTEEERRLIDAMGLVIANNAYNMPLVLVGVPNDSEE